MEIIMQISMAMEGEIVIRIIWGELSVLRVELHTTVQMSMCILYVSLHIFAHH